MALDDYAPKPVKDYPIPQDTTSIQAFTTVLEHEDKQRIDSIKSLLKSLTYGGMIKLAQELSAINGCEVEPNANSFYKLSNTLSID